MRILLAGDYPRDARLGSTKVLLKLQEEFRLLGHDCDLLLADDLGRSPRHRWLRWAFQPVAAFQAVRRAFLANGRYDVIDVSSAEGLWVGVARRLGLFRGAAIIARSHGLEHLNYRRMIDDHRAGLMSKPWTRRWWYPAVRLSQVTAAARAADRVILLNETDCAFVLARGWKPQHEIDLIPHGVSRRFLNDAPPPDHPRGCGILFCGTWDAMKGVHYLAAAFSDLIARGTPAALTVLGGAVPAESILASFAPAARSRVTVVDRVPEDEVMAAYRGHDVMAVSSSYEGYGMALLEAMTQRLPVVSTPVGCAQSLVRHEETGLIVPARDATALADALARLLADRPLRRRLAEAAWRRVQQMTWTRTAEQTLASYERALTLRSAERGLRIAERTYQHVDASQVLESQIDKSPSAVRSPQRPSVRP
jgi:glycosyltransferase involved in cell wall biosynthesis